MEIAIVVVFVLGYLAIALEHPLRLDKAASALLLGTICWAIFVLGIQEIPEGLMHYYHDFVENNTFLKDSEMVPSFLESRLLHHLSEIASILFFLLGAMTIVETVDAHGGFKLITDRITTDNKVKLIWIISTLTFFFSAVLDNLTATIVMISLLRKLIRDRPTRWFFVGFIVIAANAGGAWSPIGEVVPLLVLTMTMRGKIYRPRVSQDDEEETKITVKERSTIFIVGILGLLFVPVFKTVTHLPPFMGMMLSLGVMWAVTEVMHRDRSYNARKKLAVIGVLKKIDSASVLFFLGILLGVAALQEVGTLGNLAALLDATIGDIYVINLSIGLLSAIVDNVPLVAAAQGMYPIAETGVFAQNGSFWLFLAYCAGTGGSALIIGSAAGVAAMGIERIDFLWYMKHLTWLALLGYVAGATVFILMGS
ncbi:MAG: sodium:proton antiporter [Flavobacteriales bacterium]|nr:sodium:proton antiporter [Flavobacteriales bacterium]